MLFLRAMEHFEQKWMEVEQTLRERFDKVPDLQGILFLIGINELGNFPTHKKFTKEQKQDLMHIAVCTLLSQVGYYVLDSYDEEGWPHFLPTGVEPPQSLAQQEQLLKECIIRYFE